MTCGPLRGVCKPDGCSRKSKKDQESHDTENEDINVEDQVVVIELRGGGNAG